MSLHAFGSLPDAEQDMWIDRYQHTCPQCHGDRRTCSDPEVKWFPQRSVCGQTAEAAAADARYRTLHEKMPFHDGTFTTWSAERDEDHPYKYDDGVNIWASTVDLDPDGTWLTDDEDGPPDPDERSPWLLGAGADTAVTDADVGAAADRMVTDTTADALDRAFPHTERG